MSLRRWRRLRGLYSFSYGLQHVLCDAWPDMGFDDVVNIPRVIPRRPFVRAGTPALLLMLPLAATSPHEAR